MAIMRNDTQKQRGAALALVLLALSGLLLVLATGISSAPARAQGGFATITPAPPDPLDAARDGFIIDYALRLWSATDLTAVLVNQLELLVAGEDVPPLAVRLTLYELEARFPGAPRDPADRERVLSLMLQAGEQQPDSVDMRAFARPFVVARVNGAEPGLARLEAFDVTVQPIDLNGDEAGDAVLSVRYPADRDLPAVYTDVILVYGTGDGTYALPPTSAAWPAAPAGDISSIELLRVGDLNGDSLDEVAIGIERGAVNRELLVAGWRSGEVITLTPPDSPLLYGDILDWPQDSTALVVANYRVESARYQCVSAARQPWEWRANLFRPVQQVPATYTNLPTPGCALHGAEPLFAQPTGDAITLVSAVLAGADDVNAPGYARGGMALALLYLVDGQPQAALNQIDSLRPLAASDAWLAGQIDAFTTAIEREGISPVQVCAALTLRDATAACSVDQMLAGLFNENPLLRSAPLLAQLEALGLPVLDVVEITEVGRLPRQLVNFNLTGASWWSFAPTDPDFYVAETAEAPPGFEDAAFPPGLTEAPPAAYDALLVDGDARAALVALNNAAQSAPDVPLTPAARYFRALLYDLLNDRRSAEQAYFDLWGDFPGNHWGQLAGAHLERR